MLILRKGGARMKKAISIVLVVLSVVSILGITALAVEPRWNNANSVTVSLSIDDDGVADVTLSCIGISNVTTSIRAETKLERKWGLLWLDVDGAEWTDTTTKTYLTAYHTFQLTKTGTYRATTKCTVSGTGGSNDSITIRSEDTY